jgi:hypothetical protein
MRAARAISSERQSGLPPLQMAELGDLRTLKKPRAGSSVSMRKTRNSPTPTIMLAQQLLPWVRRSRSQLREDYDPSTLSGTFDPIHNGHIDIATRCGSL